MQKEVWKVEMKEDLHGQPTKPLFIAGDELRLMPNGELLLVEKFMPARPMATPENSTPPKPELQARPVLILAPGEYRKIYVIDPSGVARNFSDSLQGLFDIMGIVPVDADGEPIQPDPPKEEEPA